MWFKKTKKRRRRASSVTKHYLEYKERARDLITDRLLHYNEHYGLAYKRVAIRNTKRSWGSCSSLKNLNFNYKIFFLPTHLQDYIIIHELCHLAELNHGHSFWNLVAECAPDYARHVRELREIDTKTGGRVVYLATLQNQYLAPARAPKKPSSDAGTIHSPSF